MHMHLVCLLCPLDITWTDGKMLNQEFTVGCSVLQIVPNKVTKDGNVKERSIFSLFQLKHAMQWKYCSCLVHHFLISHLLSLTSF